MKDGWLSELAHHSVLTLVTYFYIVVAKVLFGQLEWFVTRWTSKATYQQISAYLWRLFYSFTLVFIEEFVDEWFDASVLFLFARWIIVEALLREFVTLLTFISLDNDAFIEGLS